MAKYKCAGARQRPPACDHEQDGPWLGACPKCRRFYGWLPKGSGDEEDRRRASLSSLADVRPPSRIPSGFPELDRVLGGDGIVKGSVILVGGRKGSGKTTLFMQVADRVAVGGRRVLYASNEQNRDDIALLARRLGIHNESVEVMGNEGDVYKIISECEERKPALLLVDAVQGAWIDDIGGDVGSTTQVEAVAKYLTSFAKTTKTSVILVCQVNKVGEFASSEALQHLVDVLVWMEAGPVIDEEGEVVEGTDDVVEISIAEKNRYGPANVRERLEMTAEGLRTVSRRTSKYLHLV